MTSIDPTEQPQVELDFLCNGVTAHRGNTWDFPENTLSSIRSAVDLGADWVELDVRRSGDGQLVVVHDADTWRVSTDGVVVADLPWWELRKVDVASVFRRYRRLDDVKCPPAEIPLLEDVLALVRGQGRTRISLHLKEDLVDDAIDMVRWSDSLPWTGFNTSDAVWLARLREAEPAACLFFDRPPEARLMEDLPLASELGVRGVVLHHTSATPEAVDEVRGAGLEAGAWTVNEVAEMQRLFEIGVQRIYTDCPGRALALKQSMSSSSDE